MKFKETRIRPNELDDKYNKLLSREIRHFFLESGSSKLKRGIAKHVRCPACDADDYDLSFEKDGFLLQLCKCCGLVFVNPRPDERTLIDFFAKSEAINLYSEMVERTKTDRYELIFHPLSHFIKNRFGTTGGRLLEVGCGVGLLLETLAKENRGWILKGVEPSEKAVAICKNKGFDVFHGSIEEHENNNSYDLIIFWAVFDHFFDPLMIVKKANEFLTNGGSILIGNMNIDGFDSEILGIDNTAFTPPERQNFFGVNSMTVMLQRAGFTEVQINTTGKLDVDIVRNYWKSGGTNGRNEFLEKIIFGPELVRNNFQSFLIENNLAGHMTVTAVKSG